MYTRVNRRLAKLDEPSIILDVYSHFANVTSVLGKREDCVKKRNEGENGQRVPEVSIDFPWQRTVRVLKRRPERSFDASNLRVRDKR